MSDTRQGEASTWSRPVKLQSGGKSSQISTPCNVQGAFCLNRSNDIDGKSRILKLLDLMPPKAFARNIIRYGLRHVVAYGLDDAMIQTLQRDDNFRSAATALLAHGSSLSLEDQRLELTMGGRIPRESSKELSTQIADAASRLEAIMGDTLNSEKSLSRLSRPWLLAIFLAVFTAPFSSSFTTESVGTFSLVPAVAVGWLLLSAAMLLLLRARLKQHALAGAVASGVMVLSVVSALFFSFSASAFLNNYVGDVLLTSQTFEVKGDVHIYYRKGAHCSLEIDATRSLIFNGHNLNVLPMPCSLAKSEMGRVKDLYTVKLNPGLLGAPFVKSFALAEAADSSDGD